MTQEKYKSQINRIKKQNSSEKKPIIVKPGKKLTKSQMPNYKLKFMLVKKHSLHNQQVPTHL